MARIGPAGTVRQQIGVQPYFKSQVKLPTEPTVPTGPSSEQVAAQEKYQREMAVYNAEKREYDQWQQAISLVFRGKGYAARGDPMMWPKVKAIHAQQAAGQKVAILAGKMPIPPTGPIPMNPFQITDVPPQVTSISKPSISRDTVVVDGLGYSVAPVLQKKFIANMQMPSGVIKPTAPIASKKITGTIAQLKYPFTTAKVKIKEGEVLATKAVKKAATTDIRMGWIFGLPTGKKIKDVKPEFIKSTGIIGETVAGSPGKKVGTIVGGVGTLFVPDTAGGLAAISLGIPAYKALPPVAKFAASTYFGVTGTKAALDKDKTPEQRIAGGIIGGLGILGATYEGLPFVRGQIGKLYPSYRPAEVQPLGFRAIRATGTQKEIGFVLPGSPARTGATAGVKLPKTSPLKRGGFEVKSSEKGLFLGSKQTVATSQINFFDSKAIGKPLPKPFYITPQDPTLKIPAARLSRTGLVDPFKPTFGSKISFGLPTKAQIGVETGVTISRTGKGGAFKIGSGSELEGIKPIGTIISGVKQTGVTTIKGQRVDIYGFTSGPGRETIVSTGASKAFAPSTATTATTSGYGFLSFLGGGALFPKTTTTITTTKPTVTSYLTPPQPRPIIPTTKKTSKGSGISGALSSMVSPPTTTISPPISLPTSSPVSPPISPPTAPTSRTSLAISPSVPLPNRITTPFPFLGIRPFREKKKKKRQGYNVQALSKGKWVSLNKKPLSRSSALGRGSRATDNTTSARFRIRKTKGKVSPVRDDYFSKNKNKFRPYKIRKGKAKKLHNEFIEKRDGGFRLDTLGEKQGLSLAKLKKQMKWGLPIKTKRRSKK